MTGKTGINFGALPPRFRRYADARVVVLPVPFDKTSTWVRGSAKGPQAIVDASRNMELYDMETGSEVYTVGIHTAKPVTASSSRNMVKNVYNAVMKLLMDKKFVVLLGGEHTVSLGSIQAHAEQCRDMSILHLDAHADMRESYERNRFSHACVMARAREVCSSIVSVGIRSMDSSEQDNVRSVEMFPASSIRTSRTWVRDVVSKLTKNVYVTIDLDVFDPSVMPSTGTPEPGGLGWYDVLDLMTAVSGKKNIVGLDVVELCPQKQNVSPDFLAAKLIYKILSLKFR